VDSSIRCPQHFTDRKFAGVSRIQLFDVVARRKAASVDGLEKIAKPLKVQPYELLQSRKE
jgi:hypothetical protein